METTEKKEMTFEEKRENKLKELYGWNYAERMKKAPISDNTRAALYIKGLVQDVESALFTLHEILYGETSDDVGGRIVNAIIPLDAIADEYLINSINDSIEVRDFKEI